VRGNCQWKNRDRESNGGGHCQRQSGYAEALKGYRRYLDLDDAAGRPVDKNGKPKDLGWYGLAGNKPVRAFVEGRLKILSES
jgi:hypothetical protein